MGGISLVRAPAGHGRWGSEEKLSLVWGEGDLEGYRDPGEGEEAASPGCPENCSPAERTPAWSCSCGGSSHPLRWQSLEEAGQKWPIFLSPYSPISHQPTEAGAS